MQMRYSFVGIRSRNLLTRAVVVVWIFRRVLRGGAFLRLPSNSVPELRSEKPRAAFESSSKTIKKVLQSILGHLNCHVTRGNQRKNVTDFRYFDNYQLQAL